MNLFTLLKIVIVVFIVGVFSGLILLNYVKYSPGKCMDCKVDRTLLGDEYDGWTKDTFLCNETKIDENSSMRCLRSGFNLKNANVTESKIKVPWVQFYNTILFSHKVKAFVVGAKDCDPGFAVDKKGYTYSHGGCLG